MRSAAPLPRMERLFIGRLRVNKRLLCAARLGDRTGGLRAAEAGPLPPPPPPPLLPRGVRTSGASEAGPDWVPALGETWGAPWLLAAAAAAEVAVVDAVSAEVPLTLAAASVAVEGRSGEPDTEADAEADVAELGDAGREAPCTELLPVGGEEGVRCRGGPPAPPLPLPLPSAAVVVGSAVLAGPLPCPALPVVVAWLRWVSALRSENIPSLVLLPRAGAVCSWAAGTSDEGCAHWPGLWP
jgi:hypothetical protein